MNLSTATREFAKVRFLARALWQTDLNSGTWKFPSLHSTWFADGCDRLILYFAEVFLRLCLLGPFTRSQR